jgi:hypothetical protein
MTVRGVVYAAGNILRPGNIFFIHFVVALRVEKLFFIRFAFALRSKIFFLCRNTRTECLK